MDSTRTAPAPTRCPDVTVLMGVFNGLPRLEHALRSVLRQTFSDFEFLIIDDGSTDESGAVLRRFATEDPRLRVVTHTDQPRTRRSPQAGRRAGTRRPRRAHGRR